MKPSVLPSALLALLVPILSPLAIVHASPPAADSVHFCAFDDYERWRRDHPRPAAKPLADLNAGEPRTVRMIYFLPNDWSYRAEVVDSMKTVIKQSQTFYREQMQAHGYGDWTFGIETDAQGEPLVHRVDGQHPFSHYDNTLGNAVVAELEQTFDLDANIYFIVLGTDALRQGNGQPAGGVGGRRTKNGGDAMVSNESLIGGGSANWGLVAHELGHAFGLRHDFRDGTYIMSYGPGLDVLSECAAEFLAVHTYFNTNTPVEETPSPAIELISSKEYPAGSKSISVEFKITDPTGVHQVILFVDGFAGLGIEVKACRGVTGKKDAVAEFEYDGAIPSKVGTNLSRRMAHPILVKAVDTEGNERLQRFGLVETSPYRIATGKGHTHWVRSVSFSPSSTMLASGGSGTVKLWEASTLAHIATLENGTIGSVSFAPSSTMLASGGSGTVKLWEASTLAHVATLKANGWVESVSFSPDGAFLAAGLSDGWIELWDVAKRDRIATLRGHTEQVTSVSFSPSSTILASGSFDETVKLWDVAKSENSATFEMQAFGVWSVSFSPDGETLAAALLGAVELWDVAAQVRIATLEEAGGVSSVSFSPDGTLASAAHDGTIKLWDVSTRENIATLPLANIARSVSFSPDGKTLASGEYDGTITLWDVSEWTAPRPFALETVSGEGQQGAPGAALAQPLVVEVRDQYGDLLPDAAVTFTVTAGEGKLSGRFTVEHVTTDARGRARLTLTLGPQPGPNTVGVSLGERELVTFTADGVGTAVAELEGDYRTWHLPAGATARLGKGALGESDRAVALSADGRCLAVASGIGVWLYEAARSRAMALLPSSEQVHSVSFSLDGTLAAGLDNGRVDLWEVETGERIGTLRHADWGGVTAVFSSDGTKLASGSLEQVIKVWDVQVIKVWDVETRRVAGTWEVPRDSDSYWDISVAFSPDGTRLASGFQDGTVRLWEVATQTEVGTLEGHTDRVTSVAFSPDGRLLASAGGGGDRTVILWDAATQAQVATLRGHTSGVRSVAFSSPDGATLASAGGWDRTVRLWDVATHEEVATLEEHGGPVHSVTFSRDGTLVSGAADGTVLLRDVETGNAAGLSGHGSLSSMALSPDGVLLASGHQDGPVRLWDAATRTPIATLGGHTSAIGSVSFSPDGALLASGSWDRTVKLWEVRTREPVGTLEGHIGGVTSVSFSPDGATLASAGGWNDATVRLWDVATREETGILEGHAKFVESVAFSRPDGALLASGGGYEDRTVKLWDVATRELIGTLEGHEYEVHAVAFSPDGKILASGSGDTRVRLWDVATRTHIATLADRNTVRSVAFSPDGQSLVSGSWGGVTLWDLTAKRRTANLQGHTGRVHSVAFSSDGATLASGSQDGTILLWNLGPHPRTLTKVPVRGQQGPAGAILDQPFTVLVLDQHGDPLAGATVTFTVTAGGGTVSVETVTTDADGRAATTLTLGPQPGTNTVEATVDRLEPVIFTATGRAVATTLDKPSGDEQEGAAGAALGEPFVVEVRDQNGNPLAGAQVDFAVTAGGGTLSATTATTDADGRAATTLTLGRTPGTTTVRATVADLEPVTFTATGLAVPRTLAKLSGDEQQAAAGAQLAEPLVVSVRDQNAAALPGAVVTFAVLGDGGTLSAAVDTTDAEGLAGTTLTLGEELGTYRVEVSVADLQPVTFTASAEATPDFDGDGETGFSDFFLFAEAFGGSDPRFDLDGSGTVDFTDFFLFAESFGQPARAKLVALARELIGLPDGPQLQQNAPNPFNSGTVISWFQLQPGPARLEVFALTGQRVAVLHDGPQKAGLHRLRWDGRDSQGRVLASGVYVYRLVTAEAVQTRKLTLLR